MSKITRRVFLKGSAGAAVGLWLSACMPAAQTGRTIKIGYVSPQTGPLAGFAEADENNSRAVNKPLSEKV